MQPYRKDLKPYARNLRAAMTEAEQHLWRRLRGKQIGGVQFYRQKPLLSFIVDFYCPAAKLVIEVDGSQHFDDAAKTKDGERDAQLASIGLHVLRFDDRQVLQETENVLGVIFEWGGETGIPPGPRNPPSAPLLQRGELRLCA